MGDYDWNYNCAIVDRLYYMEYVIRGTTLTALTLTLKDLWFIKRNWYADRALKRIPKYWCAFLGINLVSYIFLIRPLTSEEIKKQMMKRAVLGKFNYSLQMLDLDQDEKEWAEELEKRRKIESGEIVQSAPGHH